MEGFFLGVGAAQQVIDERGGDDYENTSLSYADRRRYPGAESSVIDAQVAQEYPCKREHGIGTREEHSVLAEPGKAQQ